MLECPYGTILLLGPPGSGKSTLVHGISNDYKNIKTFGVRRQMLIEMAEESKLGQALHEYILNNPQAPLLPVHLVRELFTRFVSELHPNDMAFIEGFPVNKRQSEILTTVLGTNNRKLDFIVVLQCKQEILRIRTKIRRTCTNCSAKGVIEPIYPDNIDMCPSCGHPLSQRPDDVDDIVSHRIRRYLREKRGILSRFTNTPVYEIDTRNSIDVVRKNFLDFLTGYASSRNSTPIE